MPTEYSFYLIRRLGLPLVLAGLILTITAPGLGGPAAAQFGIIGMGMGIGMGMASQPAQQNTQPPPSNSAAEHKSNKVKSARRTSSANERHAREVPANAPAKSNSNGAF